LQTRREIASGARRPSRAGANAAQRIRTDTLAIALAVSCPSDRLPAEYWRRNPHDLPIFPMCSLRAEIPEWNLRWPYAPAVRARNNVSYLTARRFSAQDRVNAIRAIKRLKADARCNIKRNSLFYNVLSIQVDNFVLFQYVNEITIFCQHLHLTIQQLYPQYSAFAVFLFKISDITADRRRVIDHEIVTARDKIRIEKFLDS
jgi:hypothetical protein